MDVEIAQVETSTTSTTTSTTTTKSTSSPKSSEVARQKSDDEAGSEGRNTNLSISFVDKSEDEESQEADKSR